MARGREPARLREVLNETGASLGLRDAVATGGLWSRWNEIVGDSIAQNAQPTSLRDGVLRVKAASPAWATELTYLAPDIVRRTNEMAGSEIVREIKVWTGPGKLTPATRKSAPPLADPAPPEERPASDRDPREALESARRAWARRRSSPRSES